MTAVSRRMRGGTFGAPSNATAEVLIMLCELTGRVHWELLAILSPCTFVDKRGA